MKEWEDIIWFEWIYQINRFGVVKNVKFNNILKSFINSCWYPWLVLQLNKKSVHKKIHKLLMECFVWPANWLDVNHIDWDKANNNLDNLEYCTRWENLKHAYATWLKKVTKNHHFFTNKNPAILKKLKKLENNAV